MKGIIRLIKRFLLSYKKYVVLTFGFNILTAFLNVFSLATIIPILQVLFKVNTGTYKFIEWNAPGSSFVDVVLNNLNWYVTQIMDMYGNTYTLMILSVFLVMMTILKTGTAYFGSYFIIPIRTGVVRDIRNQINDKILKLPIGFFSEERKGDILSRISGDVNEVENSVMSSLDMLFKNPILMLIYFITMVLLSWQLTLFVLVLLPLMGYIMGTVGKTLKKSSFEAQNKWGELMSQVEETLSGLRVIKAFNAEDDISKRFHSGSNEFRRMSNRIARRQNLAHPMSELLGTLTIAVVLWFGGSLCKILDAENEKSYTTRNTPLHFKKDIQYKDVWFKYNSEWVIKGINLHIEKGKTIALVGQSGSGKSTLADLLPRFYDIQEGGIYIDDTDIKDTGLQDLRSLFGYVNQEAILFNDTIYNNIAFGAKNKTEAQVVEAARIANAHEFIIATPKGYQTNIGDRGGKLSGGQRQRISIARAILKDPQILILDEATSALDSDSERLVQAALEHLLKNRTTIIIAHRLSTVKNADMIYVLQDGQIVESGKHDTLYALDGYYTKLCKIQGILKA